MEPDEITYRREKSIGYISLNRSGQANALTPGMIEELWRLFSSIVDSDLRVVVLSHTGDYFSAGLDLEQLEGIEKSETETLLDRYTDLLSLMQQLPIPVVSVINGKVMGGGAGLAAASDIVMVSDHAELNLPEVMAGMIPALILPLLLKRITPNCLKALALGGYTLTGRQLCHIGFADRYGEDTERLLSDQLKRLLAAGPKAVSKVKEMMGDLNGLDTSEQQSLVRNELLGWLDNYDNREAIHRFAMGEVPEWYESLHPRGPR